MKKTKSRSPFITRNQLLCVVLIVFLALNTITHFRAPAYRYYREISQALFKSQSDFEKEVKFTILPALYLVMTNGQNQTSYVPVTNVQSVVSQVSRISTDVVRRSLDFRFFLSSGLPAFEFNGHNYFVGDFFLGSPVLQVSPECVLTADTLYIVPMLEDKNKKDMVL